MTDNYIEIIGSWTSAIGTIIAAIGSTPKMYKSLIRNEDFQEKFSDDLKFIGNSLQGVGNLIEANGEKKFNLEKVGNYVQTSGNVTVLFSLTSEGKEEDKIRLDITGNLQQAFGGLIAALEEFSSTEYADRVDALGNVLQAIGNSTQAVGGVYALNKFKEESEFLEFAGSWIQAAGSLLNAYASQIE
jgi:cell division GTPase FtsZ